MITRFKPEGMLDKTPGNKEALSSPAALERAWRTGEILEAPVLLCDNRMRLHVDLGCMRGIMEREEAVYCRPTETLKDIAIITRVGKTVAFRILRFAEENGERVAILTRREVQRDCIYEFLAHLTPGDIIPARVTHLENYGAFVDIGCGVSSLLSIDCISVSRISHPRDRLTCGMYLNVVIKSIDKELSRIFVTLKELLGTWEENTAGFRAGETVVGRVRSIESYGIFVELCPNLAGLAELRGSGNTPVRCAVGDTAAVFIKSIIPERMKVKLVIIDSYPSSEPPEPLHYYIDAEKTRHIDYWEYSPQSSTRLVETIF
ncbi:MAG: 30S ribosomal protein S1 [Ruminococcaceae bacterium]|nr:30S ribosomal protein S1 [Oscillospiraceae bacterium]MBQ2772817.1 30S ribosomal protein S1 [Clostridia bacterium]